MIDHVTRIVLDAVDERGVAPPQHRQAECVQAGAVDDTRRRGGGGPSRRRPARRATGSRAGTRSPRRSSGSRRLRGRAPACADRGTSVGAKRSGASSGSVRRWLEPSRRRGPAAVPASGRPASTRCAARPRRAPGSSRTADQRPTSSTPMRRQRIEVERRPLRGADELWRRQPPRAREVVHLVVALAPQAGRVHPPQDVAAAIGARQPHVLADREDHRPSRLSQLGRQLHAGGRRADDEHAPVGELVGLRYSNGVSCSTCAGSACANAGTVGWLQAPVAISTARDRISPWLVVSS